MPDASNIASATSTAVDLSRLPPPDVIEALDFEETLALVKTDFAARYPQYDAFVESDPAIKLLEVIAYVLMVRIQQTNDAARSVMVAYAMGADLDNLGALFGVVRNEIAPADPQTGADAVMEDDEAFRRRIVLAPDSYSVAGPKSAYVFHALSADGEVLDASATSPAPGEVVVSVLSRNGDGAAGPELIAAVDAVLAADDVRPLTDLVTVQSAAIINFDITAGLTLYPGPDEQLILSTANAQLDAMLAENRRLGRDVTRSAIIAALHVAGVQNVDLVEPAADIAVDELSAASLGQRAVTIAGYDQ